MLQLLCDVITASSWGRGRGFAPSSQAGAPTLRDVPLYFFLSEAGYLSSKLVETQHSISGERWRLSAFTCMWQWRAFRAADSTKTKLFSKVTISSGNHFYSLTHTFKQLPFALTIRLWDPTRCPTFTTIILLTNKFFFSIQQPTSKVWPDLDDLSKIQMFSLY